MEEWKYVWWKERWAVRGFLPLTNFAKGCGTRALDTSSTRRDGITHRWGLLLAERACCAVMATVLLHGRAKVSVGTHVGRGARCAHRNQSISTIAMLAMLATATDGSVVLSFRSARRSFIDGRFHRDVMRPGWVPWHTMSPDGAGRAKRLLS